MDKTCGCIKLEGRQTKLKPYAFSRPAMPRYTKAELEALTVVRLRALAKANKLRVGGRKADLVARILAGNGGSSSSTSTTTTSTQHHRAGSSKTACKAPLVDETCTVAQLRARLRKIKSPVAGRKVELIARLRSLAHLEGGAPSPTPTPSPAPAPKPRRRRAGSSKTPCVTPDETCTVNQLRALLAKRHMVTTGTKAALIDRLNAASTPTPQPPQPQKRSALKGSRVKARQVAGKTSNHFSKLRFNSSEEMTRDMAKLTEARVACPTYTDSRKAKRVTDRVSLKQLASSGPHYTTQLCSKNAPILYAEPNSDEPCCRPRVFATDPKPSDTIDESGTVRLSKKANTTFAKALKGRKPIPTKTKTKTSSKASRKGRKTRR